MGSYHYGRAGAALHTISAIDIALWDIAGQAAGLPISELLGGRRVDAMTVYASQVMPETAAEVRADRRAGGVGRLHRAQAGVGAAGPKPRLGRRADHRGPRGARPRSQADGRRWHGLLGQEGAGTAGGGRATATSTGWKSRWPQTTTAGTGGCPTAPRSGSRPARPIPASPPIARWWSTATWTCCSRIWRAAAGSPSAGRSPTWPARPASRWCRTASRRGCWWRHRCTSPRRSIGPRCRSSRWPTHRWWASCSRSRSSSPRVSSRFRPDRGSALS